MFLSDTYKLSKADCTPVELKVYNEMYKKTQTLETSSPSNKSNGGRILYLCTKTGLVGMTST